MLMFPQVASSSGHLIIHPTANYSISVFTQFGLIHSA